MKKSQKGFAKKSLGQNFLQSAEIRDQILTHAGDITGRNILEIGPGLGFLTTKLLAEDANVTAVELDDRASEILRRDFGHKSNFRLIQGDILKQDLDILFAENEIPQPYRIIANIPYNITAPILKKMLAKTQNKPETALLMVQKEVAEKICDSNKRSILSISVEIFSQARIAFLVGREHFSPVPKVDSAILRLDIREESLVPAEMEKDFFTVVNAGFSQKRKKLANVLPGYFGVTKAQILGGLDGNRRAETLDIAEWILLTKNFQVHCR